MFNKNNFCHIASNNRNEKKAGVFVYKTTDNLATVSVSGYFNDKIIDINLHDLIIHEWHDATDKTKVQKNVLCVIERTLDNVGTVVIKSKWEEDIDQSIEDLRTYVDATFVRKDGTSVMTGPLKMRSGSMQGAIAPYWNGIGLFKLESNNNVALLASMDDSYGFVPATTNTYGLGSSTYKWKNLYLSGTAFINTINNGVSLSVPTPAQADTLAVLGDIAFKSADVAITSPSNGQFLMYDGNKWVNSTQGYANTDLSNLTSAGKNIANWSTNTANCITEIPQDIKLELNAGTLTLKAGSKVYVPNGAGVFDTYTVASDITTNSFAGSVTRFVFVDINNNTINAASAVFSGTTPPTLSGTGFWYDTTNNVIKMTTDSGATWTTGYSFPIAIVTSISGVATSIDQIFNGFGFIGSTVFALPGVKGLAPNGRNSDGSLRNAETSITQITTWTNNGYTFKDFQMKITNNGLAVGSYAYDEIYNINNEVGCIVGLVGGTSGSIDYIKPKTVFHAVDTNDINHILAAMYPIGALYIGTQNTCPMSIVMPGTIWEIVATNRALWGGDGTNGTTTIAAGLPNFSVTLAAGDLQKNGSDGSELVTWSVTSGGGVHTQRQVTVKGSDSSSIYSDSVTTVQPPAYVVNVWRRVS